VELYRKDIDVLVVGGGTAGTVAAIQSARAGARTALVEMGPQLGGAITTGGVSAPAYFYSRDRQVIAGIGWELVVQTMALDGKPLPDFQHPRAERPSYHVGLNGPLYALIAEEACLAAGVTLHYHEIATAMRQTEAGWQVETVGKNLRREITAREVIDCTGDADLVGMAGFERVQGQVRQPGTMEFRIGGYDLAALDADLIQARYRQALQEGRLQPGDFYQADGFFLDFLRLAGFNCQHIVGADSTTSATQTEANIRGRRSLLRLLRFVRSLPGCENARLLYASPITTPRETYRIVGEQTVTHEDYITGRIFPDAICYTYYFIDVHTDKGIEREFVPAGLVPTIPLGALVPRGSRHLLTAGRTVSSDRLAHSALRVQASCMAMGQAAGAAAAWGALHDIASRDVPLDELRALLRAHGAIVPEQKPV